MVERPADSRAHRAELVDFFARELAIYVGRSVRNVRREGLRADDFDGDVLVDFADGSTMTLTHAIAVQNKSKSIGVFTEHCGYYVFEPADVRVSRAWDGHVFHRYGTLSDVESSVAGRLWINGREFVALPRAAYDHLAKAEPTTDAIASVRL